MPIPSLESKFCVAHCIIHAVLTTNGALPKPGLLVLTTALLLMTKDLIAKHTIQDMVLWKGNDATSLRIVAMGVNS